MQILGMTSDEMFVNGSDSVQRIKPESPETKLIKVFNDKLAEPRRPLLQGSEFSLCFLLAFDRGTMVIASASETEELEFESQPGCRFIVLFEYT
jgi:hypothetical protein